MDHAAAGRYNATAAGGNKAADDRYANLLLTLFKQTKTMLLCCSRQRLPASSGVSVCAA